MSTKMLDKERLDFLDKHIFSVYLLDNGFEVAWTSDDGVIAIEQGSDIREAIDAAIDSDLRRKEKA